jgi:hypothetical protein
MSDVVRDYSDVKDTVELSIGDRTKITNRRGNVITPRKYHMADDQIEEARNRWRELIKDVPASIRHKARRSFFNPFRVNGSYFGQVQALYLLGANEWHTYSSVRGKMQEDMSTRKSPLNTLNSWEKFATRSAREGATSTKDLMGRIVSNFRTLQRLGGTNPYGYKLKQLLSSVDARRRVDSIWEFRLDTTWTDMDLVKPFYDISAYVVPKGKKVDTVVVSTDVPVVD